MDRLDDDLVRAAQDGDRSAFEELIRRTGRLLYAHIYLRTADRQHVGVEDLLQDTLLAAWRSIRQLQDPKAFRPWITAIADRTITDAARYRFRLKRTAERMDASPENLAGAKDPGLSPERRAQQSELRERLLRALAELPAQYREPLALRYLADADHEAIGKQLGLSNGALRGLLHRGLRMLREALEGEPRA